MARKLKLTTITLGSVLIGAQQTCTNNYPFLGPIPIFMTNHYRETSSPTVISNEPYIADFERFGEGYKIELHDMLGKQLYPTEFYDVNGDNKIDKAKGEL